MKQALDAYDHRDCPRALRLTAPVIEAARAPAQLLAQAYAVAAACEYSIADYDTAYRHALAGTRLPSGSDWLWGLRFALEFDRKQWVAAMATIEAMHRDRPKALAALEVSWLAHLDRELKDAHEDGPRRRLLAILTAPGYTPAEPVATVDWARQSYAEILMASSDRAAARAQVAAVTNPAILIELSFDPRFRTMLPADLDLRAAFERDLARTRAIMAANPDLLGPLHVAANALLRLGRPQEALALLESARARVEDETHPFADAGEKIHWWWDNLARTNERLGRTDAAIAAFRAGAKQGEGSDLNVSQTINLAHALNRAGRPREALATLAAFGPSSLASPYGYAEMHQARGCANILIGDRAGAAKDLEYLRAHEADNRSALSSLLLCMNDLDGAAAAFIRRLDDPDQRGETLAELADYDPSPIARPANPTASKLPALKARPDVRAAIARAGGTRRIHLQPREY